MNKNLLSNKISNLQDAHNTLKRESLGKLADKFDFIERKAVQSSRLFMIDIIPYIHRLYYDLPKDSVIRVLDVGIHCGSGTALLAELHNRQSYNHLKMVVTGLDIIDHYENYIKLCYPSFKFIKKDIFDIPDNEKWDLVICSHVIEHLKEPFSFVEKLRKLTNKYAIVACPYNETDLRSGHIQTIDDAIISQLNPLEHHIYTNFSWRVKGECLIMIFDAL